MEYGTAFISYVVYTYIISPYQCTSHNSHNISVRYSIYIYKYIHDYLIYPILSLDQDDFTPVLLDATFGLQHAHATDDLK